MSKHYRIILNAMVCLNRRNQFNQKKPAYPVVIAMSSSFRVCGSQIGRKKDGQVEYWTEEHEKKALVIVSPETLGRHCDRQRRVAIQLLRQKNACCFV